MYAPLPANVLQTPLGTACPPHHPFSKVGTSRCTPNTTAKAPASAKSALQPSERGHSGGGSNGHATAAAAAAASTIGGGHECSCRGCSAYDGTLFSAARRPALWLSSALATEMSSPGILPAV